jgi:hypothetical protein
LVICLEPAIKLLELLQQIGEYFATSAGSRFSASSRISGS